MIRGKVNSRKLLKKLGRIKRRTNSMPYAAVGEMVKASIKEMFVSGGSPIAWAPRKVNKPWPILRKTNKLMNATYSKPSKNKVVIGNRTKYQAVHNFGFAPRGIAMRKFMFVKAKVVINIKQLFKSHITKR